MLEMFMQTIMDIANTSGLANMTWRQMVMMGISFVLIYLATAKGFEPLLLLPIAFGMFLANLPMGGVFNEPQTLMELLSSPDALKEGWTLKEVFVENGESIYYGYKNITGGLIYYLYQGVKLGIYPPLIFMGVGAMVDFGPLIANPKSFLLGAAAQLGIFIAFLGALALGFTPQEAGSIGIIGGADGPTAIYTTTKLAQHLLPSIAIAAYSYMALVPIIQPPIMKALTTDRERKIVMEQLRPVSKVERIIFPIFSTLVVALMVPDATPLVGMLMLGNLFRESGVTERLSKTAQNELMNIVTIFLALSVGATARGETFLTLQTLGIIAMGLAAFCFGTLAALFLAR